MANGVTNEQRYALTARGRDTAEAGLIRKRDGTSWVVQPDGSEQQLPGGGGSSGVVSRFANGLVKDLNLGDLEGTGSVVLDPTAQPWEAGVELSNAGSGGGDINVGAMVTPSTNPNSVKFVAFENGSAVSGSVEPVWSQDGATPVNDGTVTRPLVWSPNGIYQLWTAGAALTGTVIGNGFSWLSDSGGLSGGSEPAWPAAPNVGDTVTDNAITWIVSGPCAAWQQSHRYSFRPDLPQPTANYMQFNVIPTGAIPNTDYVFIGQPTGAFGTTGSLEPSGWGAAMPGDFSVWIDGDIMWTETTTDEALVITGIVAPSAASLIVLTNGADPGTTILITLEDEANVTSDFGADAESAIGNRINGGGSNVALSSYAFNPLLYRGNEWRPRLVLGS